MIHQLKCWEPFFADVVSGAKSFEVRRNDRKFAVGDLIDLCETSCGRETGRSFRVVVTYVLPAHSVPESALEPGFVVLGIRR